ncbi:MAG TPA: ABC transporter ATP-binding protein [Dehalococcoidia bacterium]|nr:ABC transporter ATP-binding protein [Dehalococcoidia bacterium]HIL32008.1 ABC transporter ATP-binding protein [Dehalococcoidia bacterium]
MIFCAIMEPAVQVENLVKRFGTFTALDGVTFAVERGEVFGILGPNGAGKTTTLEIIESLQKPTEGRVSVLGLDLQSKAAEVKARIGVQLQASAYYDYLNLTEILALLGSFYPNKAAPATLLEQVGLSDKAVNRVAELSGGQKQRFAVAASLVNNPELVVLDEPTTGLDPQARRNLWSLIKEVNQRGVTVVLTTHAMDEAELLCSRLAIMDQGKLLAVDTPRNLINKLEASYAVKLTMDRPMTMAQLEALNGRVEVLQSGEQNDPAAEDQESNIAENTYLLRLANSPSALKSMLDEIAKTGLGLENLQITPVTLEDVFLELTGTELRD